MRLHSISTSIGAAVLVEISSPIHSIDAPPGYGLIFWGRCNRVTLGTIVLGSKARWIADYDIQSKQAIVLWPPELAGKALDIDTSAVDAICPGCGSTHYISSGINWRCKECDRQWRKTKAL